MAVDLLCLPLCHGCVPNHLRMKGMEGNNPQVELMPLCSVSVACSAVFLAVN